MKKEFKDYVLDEIEEVDELGFILLIPKYLEMIKGIDLKGGLINEFPTNYDIADSDFSALQNEIKSLIESENLEICRYHDTHSSKRKDYLRPLKKAEQEAFLKEKFNWIYKKDKPAYFLCKKQ